MDIKSKIKVAIDKDCINKVKDFNEFEYIYTYDDETAEELLKLNLHCIRHDYIKEVDINLSKYEIDCYKKASINNKDWKKMPDIENKTYAIIVPNCNNDHGNYKGKTFLQNCIESVLNQTYKNYYLIIVDDLSTDTSVETIEEYRSKEEYIDKIHLIKNRRKRYNGGSRNVGIEYALDNLDFDYFCFLDSDDWWIDNEVLKHINRKIYNNEMMILGSQRLFTNGEKAETYNKFDTYEDVYFCLNKVWCTAWSRVIRKDKIVYFCEDTLMEDRVWSYKQADNINFNKIVNIKEICYVWNRMNTSNSVSEVRNNIWNASAWCHIGHQLQFMENMKHKEYKEQLRKRIKRCINKAYNGEYQQY